MMDLYWLSDRKPNINQKLSSLKIFGLHNSGSISKTDGKNSQHEPFSLLSGERDTHLTDVKLYRKHKRAPLSN